MNLIKRNLTKKQKYAKSIKTKSNKKSNKSYKIKRGKTQKQKYAKIQPNKNPSGGSKVYQMNGDIDPIYETFEDKPIFRKMTKNKKEIELCKLIMQNSYPNIITIYNIFESPDLTKPSYIDMEELNTNIESYSNTQIKEIMLPVKSFLQGLGIMYIDWKPDNVGLAANGQLKLFDFDCSGLIDINTNEWILPAPKLMYNYRQAINAGFTNPIDIDNYAFDNAFV